MERIKCIVVRVEREKSESEVKTCVIFGYFYKDSWEKGKQIIFRTTIFFFFLIIDEHETIFFAVYKSVRTANKQAQLIHFSKKR